MAPTACQRHLEVVLLNWGHLPPPRSEPKPLFSSSGFASTSSDLKESSSSDVDMSHTRPTDICNFLMLSGRASRTCLATLGKIVTEIWSSCSVHRARVKSNNVSGVCCERISRVSRRGLFCSRAEAMSLGAGDQARFLASEKMMRSLDRLVRGKGGSFRRGSSR